MMLNIPEADSMIAWSREMSAVRPPPASTSGRKPAYAPIYILLDQRNAQSCVDGVQQEGDFL